MVSGIVTLVECRRHLRAKRTQKKTQREKLGKNTIFVFLEWIRAPNIGSGRSDVLRYSSADRAQEVNAAYRINGFRVAGMRAVPAQHSRPLRECHEAAPDWSVARPRALRNAWWRVVG